MSPQQSGEGRVLIDATNLRTGGAVQVAASFVDELAEMAATADKRGTWLTSMDLAVSRRVFNSLGESARRLPGLSVRESRPMGVSRWLPRRRGYDVSFVVFGPEYGWPRAKRRICGYADVRSIYPSPEGEIITPKAALRWRIRGVVSRALVKRSDRIIVETSAFRAQLLAKGIGSPGRVEVVPNTYNGIFDRPTDWRVPDALPERVDCDYLLSYVTRPYPHKNLGFLPKVRREGLELGVSIKFLTTLTAAEWAAQTPALREACVNLGALPVQAVPEAHRRADAAIFPSLLEVFSAMPLEAMRVARVVFASDRDFVRTTCADAPVYIDPLDERSVARKIIETLQDPDTVERHINAGTRVLAGHPSSQRRALGYVDAITRELAVCR